MRSLSLSDAVSQGWEFAKKHGLLLAAIIFGFSILTGMINSLAVPQDFWANYMKAVQSQDMNSLQNMIDANNTSVLSHVVSTIDVCNDLSEIFCSEPPSGTYHHGWYSSLHHPRYFLRYPSGFRRLVHPRSS